MLQKSCGGSTRKLPLVRRVGRSARCTLPLSSTLVQSPVADAAQVGNLVHQQPEHVIERAVLHHQHDDVLDARMPGAVLVRPRRVRAPETPTVAAAAPRATVDSHSRRPVVFAMVNVSGGREARGPQAYGSSLDDRGPPGLRTIIRRPISSHVRWTISR